MYHATVQTHPLSDSPGAPDNDGSGAGSGTRTVATGHRLTEGTVPGDCSPLMKLSVAPAARALAIIISLAFLFLDGMDG